MVALKLLLFSLSLYTSSSIKWGLKTLIPIYWESVEKICGAWGGREVLVGVDYQADPEKSTRGEYLDIV